ncbi:MAG: D-2-hydroxyacid dehydrogenase [Acidimicrobiaceae bacterium]|nr:D-2-hydroxyacid dehydrogenase [Acidimicrobiaceae bacterium]
MAGSSTQPDHRRGDGSGHVLFCTDTFLRDHGPRLRAAAPGLDAVVLDSSDTIAAADIERATIAFMSRDTWPARARAFIDGVMAAKSLDWFHVMSAGVDGPPFDTLRARGVRVTRSAGASANAMAESVFMFLHGLSRNLRNAHLDYAQRRFEWHRWRELEHRRIAVLGYGPVGQRIVHLALAYGMQPTIVRRHARGDEPCPTRAVNELREIVADHDVIVIALPVTDDTRNIVSTDVIAAMAPETVVINVARGALVDQTALTEALKAGRVAGAGLDVFVTEPLPPDDPLWELPNVLITPHNSGSSHGSPLRVIDLFFDNLDLYLAGRPMHYEVPA